jgi:ubiquinone/menaquinone biosynthesis C-methylase UbiE
MERPSWPGASAQPSAAEAFLRDLVRKELAEEFGLADAAHLDEIVAQWMDDANDAGWRFAELEAFQPGARRVLDMACGCGTAVFWGLRNGWDAYGIDPNPDKHRFMALKAEAYGYPGEWLSRVREGYGEHLPYADGEFDAVMSYQTLEHVQHPRQVLAELVRVTRAGGCVNLRFPDFRGTFEGHYMLPWLPLFPRPAAKAYLRLLGRPARGLDGIRYVTGRSVRRLIGSLSAEHPSWRLEIHDGGRLRFLRALGSKGLPAWGWLYFPYQALTHLRSLFRRDIGANLFIRVLAK